ncbi:MAG: hypothetical protein R6V49_07825, partial [Bacteroidales bacterium]
MMGTLLKTFDRSTGFLLMLLFAGAAVLSSGCLKEDDFKDFNTPTLNPTIAFPVGTAKLTIADILNEAGESEFLMEDSTGFLTIYHRSTLVSETAGDLIKFDRQEMDTTVNIIFPVNLPVGDSLVLSYPFTQTFSNSDDDVVDSIRFKQGDFIIEIESMMDHDAKLILSSPFMSRLDGEPDGRQEQGCATEREHLEKSTPGEHNNTSCYHRCEKQ